MKNPFSSEELLQLRVSTDRRSGDDWFQVIHKYARNYRAHPFSIIFALDSPDYRCANSMKEGYALGKTPSRSGIRIHLRCCLAYLMWHGRQRTLRLKRI